MKFSALVTLLLSSSAAFAAAMNRDVIQARQAHVKKDLVDVCVALDVDVQLAPGGHNIIAGHLNLCLCLSVLPGFLGSNSVARTVVNILGLDGARDYFTRLIQDQQNKQQCHYPPHAISFCSIQRPCDFHCGDGYTPFPGTNPTQCICKAPYTECNGVCGSFPHGCGSQGLSRNRRGQPACPVGKTMCGVPSGRGVDCVNTYADAESCGGCTVASPFGNNVADGRNCKAIPNVDRVLCDGGNCKVLSCKDGFDASTAREGCVRRPLNRVRKTRGAEVVDDAFDRLTNRELLADWYNVVIGKAEVLARLDILDYDHILQFLLDQGAIVGVPDLFKLKDMLGLDASVLRRDAPYTVDYVLDVLWGKKLIVKCDDLLCIEGFLGAKIETFNIDDLLELLVGQGLIVEGTNLIDLRQLFGLKVGVL